MPDDNAVAEKLRRIRRIRNSEFSGNFFEVV